MNVLLAIWQQFKIFMNLKNSLQVNAHQICALYAHKSLKEYKLILWIHSSFFYNHLEKKFHHAILIECHLQGFRTKTRDSFVPNAPIGIKLLLHSIFIEVDHCMTLFLHRIVDVTYDLQTIYIYNEENCHHPLYASDWKHEFQWRPYHHFLLKSVPNS